MPAAIPETRHAPAFVVGRALPFALLVALLSACSDSTGTDDTGPPAAMVIVDGDDQEAPAGRELPEPLVVRVTDDRGRPIRNQLVNWRVTEGGGTVFAGSALTNREGEARERWTLGTAAGSGQSLEARAVNSETGEPLVFATFTARARAADPASLEIVSGSEGGGQVGTVLDPAPSVRVRDAFGNVVPGAPVTWTVRAGGGTVTPTSVATGPDGVASASWMLGTTAGEQRLEAGTAGASPVTLIADAMPGPATRLVIAGGNDQEGRAGMRLPEPLVARAEDQYGNAVEGAEVQWMTMHGSVSLAVSASDEEGLARTSWTLGSTVGPQQAEARLGSTASLTFRSVATAPPPGVSRVAQSSFHTCALTSTGEAYCWGWYHYLPAAGSDAPVPVAPGLRFVEIAAGVHATCGIATDGLTYCWGDNVAGRLGDGTDAPRMEPRPVAGGHRFVAISGEGYHFCGLKADGSAYCWGSNADGQLGSARVRCLSASIDCRAEPTPVNTSLRFRSISAGGGSRQSHTCALTESGAAYCWGAGYGSTPMLVPSPVPFGAIEVGGGTSSPNTCALDASGSAYCWGQNSWGALGDGTVTDRTAPTPVASEQRFMSIAQSGGHACALTSGGESYCWGLNLHGSLATDGVSPDECGTTELPRPCSKSPIRSSTSETFTAVVGDDLSSCALTLDGRLFCWGSNATGKLGDGTRIDRSVPVAVSIPE